MINHSDIIYISFYMAATRLTYIFLSTVLTFLCEASDQHCMKVLKAERYQNGSINVKSLATQLKTECMNQSCYHNHWNITIMRMWNNSENASCINAIFCCVFQCRSDNEAAKANAEKELKKLISTSIIRPNSSSKINSCEISDRDQICDFDFKIQSSGASNIKVEFLRNGVNFSTVSAVAVISKRLVNQTKVKNLQINPGDILRFGDKAPVVIAVQQGNNVSRKVKIIIDQRYPLDYVDRSIRVRKISAICAFYDGKDDKWNPSACKNPPTILKTSISCSCDHNSAFAVMFSVTEIKVDSTISMVSVIFEIASIVALLATCTLLIFYRKKLRNFDRVLVQIGLCISLAMTHLFMILSEVANPSNLFCQAVIVITHYFLVCTTVLMVLEGGMMLINVLFPTAMDHSHSGRRRVIAFILAWIVPMVYAGVCAGIGIRNGSYGNYLKEADRFEVCWITDSFNLVVIIPVAVATGINTLIVIRLGVLVASLSHKAEDFKPSHERHVKPMTHAAKAFRAVIILLPILGIPWAIGFLVNTGYPTNVVFVSIHLVVNGCQGIFIFLHYVVFNSDMKTCIRRSWESTKSEIASFPPVVHFTNNRTDSTVTLKAD